MVSNCANPECRARFQYLNRGKLFHFEVIADRDKMDRQAGSKRPPKRVEHFWLCDKCASYLTLRQEASAIIVVPLFKQAHRAIA